MEINNKTFGRFSMAPNGVDFIDVSAFVEWKDVTVHCTFEDGNAQSNLSMSEVKFVGQSADLLYAYYEAGRNGTGNGIMQGVPYSITFFNDINSTVVFNGYIDMRDAKFNDSQHIVMATLKKRDNLFKLEDDLGGLTWGYLESIGLVKAADYFDFEYGVQKKINTIELIMLAMSIYSLTTELVKIARQIVADIAHVLGHTIGGAPVPTAPASGIIVTIVLILIQIAEMLLIMYALTELMAQLIAQLIPIKRTAKVLNYRKACTIISSYFGYTFESNITDLDKFYYMPSNVTYDSVNLTTGLVEEFLGCQKGIPNTTDYGYNAGQFMTILTNQFNARKAIINGKLCFYNVEDPFWKKNSTYKILPTWDETRSTNANDLVSSIMLSYEVDYSDEHTITAFKGTSYEVLTKYINSTDPKLSQINKSEQIKIGICLCDRKNELSGFEEFLKDFAGVADGVINFFGGNSTLADQFQDIIGMGVVGNNNYSLPKSIKLNGKRLVERSECSAKYIFDKYYVGKAFARTVGIIPFYAQKEIYNTNKFGFGMNDFVSLVENNFCESPKGQDAGVIEFTWKMDETEAKASYFVRNFWTSNLKEIQIEPDNIQI